MSMVAIQYMVVVECEDERDPRDGQIALTSNEGGARTVRGHGHHCLAGHIAELPVQYD
jgi:hypothetical protein